jgi:hypothetical protein
MLYANTACVSKMDSKNRLTIVEQNFTITMQEDGTGI